MNLLRVGIDKARMTIVAFMILLVGGIINYPTVPRESMPDVAIPVVYVTTGLDGISPEDSERVLLRPLEERLRSIEGVKEIDATSYEGGANIVMEFDVGFDKQKAIDDVRLKVDEAKSELPDDAKEPQVHEINLSSFPVLQVIFSGAYDMRTLTNIVEDIREEVLTIPSVLEANISGGREERLEVIIDPDILESYGITTDQISRQILSYNRLVAAGNVESDSGRFFIKLPGLIENYRDVEGIPILADESGTIRVGDIADIRRTYKDANNLTRTNGESAVGLEIVKRKGENTIVTVDEVRRIVSEQAEQYKPELKVLFSQDASTDIKNQLSNLTNSVITSVLLVMIIILALLGIQSGILVSLSIPATLLIGLLVINISGLTLNIVVLFAIVLAVGLMVDAAVVTVEFANRRMREGAPPSQAYSEASRRMALPITSSTITTLAAFLPLIFMPGIVGKVMQYLPITLIIMLATSLVVALFFIPILGIYFSMICLVLITLVGGLLFFKLSWDVTQAISNLLVSQFHLQGSSVESGLLFLSLLITAVIGVGGTFLLARTGHRLALRHDPHYRRSRISASGLDEVSEPTVIDESKVKGLTRYYLNFVRACLKRPKTTIVAAFSVSIICFGVSAVFNYGSEFFPDVEDDRAAVSVRTIGNLSLKESDAIIRQVEQRILVLKEERQEISHIQSYIGRSRNAAKGTIGRVEIDLIDWDERRHVEIILHEIREALSDIGGIQLSTRVPRGGPQSEKEIDLRVLGDDHKMVEIASRKILVLMEDMQVFRNTSDSLPEPGIEWQLRIDREEVARSDVSLNQIGSYVRMATSGYTLSSYRPLDSDDEVDIVARFPVNYRNLSQLEQLRIPTGTGAISVTDLLDRVAQPRSQELKRLDSRPFVNISTDVLADLQSNQVLKEFKEALAQLDLDPNVDLSFGGDQQSSDESQAFLIQAFIFSFGLIFIILLAQFNSFMHCVIIMSAIIMSASGVFLGHVFMKEPFGTIMSGIGLVSLSGIVVNNNIVLLDTFDHLRKQVSDIRQAIILTCIYRFRPVMLTSVTTILSILPSMFEVNLDFAAHALSYGAPAMSFWRQIAISIVFGMSLATIWTLVVTPTALLLTASYSEKGIRRRFPLSDSLARPQVAEQSS